MDDGYVGDDDYVRMLVLLATSMVIMIVPVIATIGNGNEAYCLNLLMSAAMMMSMLLMTVVMAVLDEN